MTLTQEEMNNYTVILHEELIPGNGLHGTHCDCLCRGEGEKPL